jgi:hypothetical protein
MRSGPVLTVLHLHKDNAAYRARQITGRLSYRLAERRADMEWLRELEGMIPRERNLYMRVNSPACGMK